MKKIYSVNFLMNGKIWETRNFDTNKEAWDFIRGYWHHTYWNFKIVCDNDTHKVWHAE